MISRDFIHTSGHVGVYAISPKSPEFYAGWYGLAHVGTGLPFPMVFEHTKHAVAACQQLDAMADWDEWVKRVREERAFLPEFDRFVTRQLFSIADDNLGALLGNDPLPRNKIALMARAPQTDDEAA